MVLPDVHAHANIVSEDFGGPSAVDGFFDDVMVMTDDQNLRRNRLALLGKISELFGTIADFSKIST